MLEISLHGKQHPQNNLSWHRLTAISHKGQRVVKQCFILRIVISALYLLQWMKEDPTARVFSIYQQQNIKQIGERAVLPLHLLCRQPNSFSPSLWGLQCKVSSLKHMRKGLLLLPLSYWLEYSALCFTAIITLGQVNFPKETKRTRGWGSEPQKEQKMGFPPLGTTAQLCRVCLPSHRA